VLQLGLSPAKLTPDIIGRLDANPDEKLKAAQELGVLCNDITFCIEFTEKQGLERLIKLIETTDSGKINDQILAATLPAFVDLLDHGITQWDIIEPPFIKKIASLINNQTTAQDPRTLQASLSILESLVFNSNKYQQVDKELTIPNLAMHLQNSSPAIQTNTLALINALFLKADDYKRCSIAATLNVRQIRNSFVVNILQGSATQVGNEMAHQLHVLQTLMLNVLEDRVNKPVDPNDADAQEKIRELCRIAFDADLSDVQVRDVTTRKTNLEVKNYRKLGFKNETTPLKDFDQVPPGSLALDAMLYFARYHPEKYTRVVLENSGRGDEYDCPFARAAIELTKLLCELLKIGDAPTEQGTTFHPMFFNHDHPFEELFCNCVVVVNKTWKEMRATVEDFTKVFSVVREQITRVLSAKPSTQEIFRDKIATLTYAEITDLWQQERNSREKWESRSKPIMILRDRLRGEVVDIIQEHRFMFMKEGTRFNKYSHRGRVKDKFWFIRLSPNHRVLHYGDCDEKMIPSIDELSNKLPVSEISTLMVGKDCPHMKDARGKKTTAQLAFSLLLETNDMTSLDFVAPDQQIYDYWVDGINILLGNNMNSKEAAHDTEVILAMYVKVRMLDLEGLDLPEDPPTIPPEPTDYEFAIETK